MEPRVSINFVNPKDVTFKLAAEVSAIYLECFQHEQLTQIIFGPRYSMPVPPPASRRGDFKRLWFANSLATFQSLTDVNTLNWTLKVDGELAGLVGWQLPEGLRKKLGYAERIKAWLLRKFSNLLTAFIFFFDSRRPDKLPAIVQSAFLEFETAANLNDYDPQEFAEMTPEQLSTTRYPRKLCTWCHRLMVKPCFQQRGYGELLFGHSLKLVPRYHPVFESGSKSSIGPAKLALFSSESGLKVYKKFGFEVAVDRPMIIGDVTIRSPLCVRSEC